MGAGDLGAIIKIGDGLGDFKKSIEDAGGEVELVGGGLHERLAFIIHLDDFFEFTRSHFGVGFAFSETVGLFSAGGKNAFADLMAGGAGRDGGKFFGFETGDIDVKVDAVEERARDFCGVLEALGGPDAVGFGIAFESAGAGVHGTDEHSSGGESEGGLDTGDGDNVVFERLAEGFEDVATEFGHFIEKENSVVSERDFTGFWGFAAAHDGGVTGCVVGGSEGSLPDKSTLIGEFAR